MRDRLEQLLAIVQTDPGNRGLAKVPGRNLFTACATHFVDLIENLAATPQLAIDIETGFMIPNINPPRFETDGPLGAAFLLRAGLQLGI
ncbi:MAG: hypothetical protein ACRCZF_20095, partial [Gemmataceae bacterium]